MSTNDLVWAAAQVYLELLDESLNDSVERIKDYGTYSALEITGGKPACSEREYEGNCFYTASAIYPRRVPKSSVVIWIRLNCRRLSNFGLIMTLSRAKLLLDYLTSWTIETSVPGISYGKTLRIALRTRYQKLSISTNNMFKHISRVKYAIGEVLGVGISQDDRGSVVLERGRDLNT